MHRKEIYTTKSKDFPRVNNTCKRKFKTFHFISSETFSLFVLAKYPSNDHLYLQANLASTYIGFDDERSHIKIQLSKAYAICFVIVSVNWNL